MSHSRNDRNEENKTVEDPNSQIALLQQVQRTAIKRQAELATKIKNDALSLSKERKANAEEKTKFITQIKNLEEEKTAFITQIKNLEFENRHLSVASEQLDLDLIKANEKIKQLTETLQQLESDLSKANEQIKSLTDAPQQIASSTLENKASSTEADHAAPAAKEPVTGKEATIETPAGVGPSSLSMFSPWRILGYTDAKSTPAQENPAHISLADLTKASVEQALAENNALPGLRK